MDHTPLSARSPQPSPDASLSGRAALDAVLAEAARRRMERKVRRVEALAVETGGDWERVFFALLARAMGAGSRGEMFMRWALALDLRAAAKHRDDCTLVEALFLGTAGLLDIPPAEAARQPEYAETLRREYAFLRHKFSLRPMDGRLWPVRGHRPQSATPLRLAQLAAIFRNGLTLSQVCETTSADALRSRLCAAPADFWRTHYGLYASTLPHSATLSRAAADLILINAVAPAVCAYGRAMKRPESEPRALALWAALEAERNRITQSWAARGLKARSALESQALLQIDEDYCRAEGCADCPMRPFCPPTPGQSSLASR